MLISNDYRNIYLFYIKHIDIANWHNSAYCLEPTPLGNKENSLE